MIDGSSHLAFIGPGGPEILIVMLVLLLLFGAQDAPRIFRKLNEILNHIRTTADNFKHEVMYGDINAGTPQNEPLGDYDDYGLAADNAEEDEPGGAVVSEEAAEGDIDGENDDKPV